MYRSKARKEFFRRLYNALKVCFLGYLERWQAAWVAVCSIIRVALSRCMGNGGTKYTCTSRRHCVGAFRATVRDHSSCKLPLRFRGVHLSEFKRMLL